MAPRSNRRSEISIDKQIGRVQAKMKNLAHRSSSACVTVLREYADKVRLRAAWYAPEDTGALGNPSNWQVIEEKSGINRRLEFTVRIKPWAKRREKKRVVPVTRYAKYMHDDRGYKIRGRDKWGNDTHSRAKANRTPPVGQKRLSKYPNGSGHYVGRLFLTRAINSYRLVALEAMRKAVAKELR